MSSLESKVLQLQAILDSVVRDSAVLAICLIDAAPSAQEYICWAGKEPPSKDILAAAVAEWINGSTTKAILELFDRMAGAEENRVMELSFAAGTTAHHMQHVIKPLKDPQAPLQTRFVLCYAIDGSVSSGASRLHLKTAEDKIIQQLGGR